MTQFAPKLVHQHLPSLFAAASDSAKSRYLEFFDTKN